MKPNFNTNKFYPCIAWSLSKIACNKQADNDHWSLLHVNHMIMYMCIYRSNESE